MANLRSAQTQAGKIAVQIVPLPVVPGRKQMNQSRSEYVVAIIDDTRIKFLPYIV